MTDEQINAAIARALNADEHWMIQKDYCTDLNAMHEAEEFLSGNLWIGYVNDLANIEGNLFGIRATARQRAEAFLRTLGKWEEATDKESLTVESTTEQSSSVHIGDTTEMMKEVQK